MVSSFKFHIKLLEHVLHTMNMSLYLFNIVNTFIIYVKHYVLTFVYDTLRKHLFDVDPPFQVFGHFNALILSLPHQSLCIEISAGHKDKFRIENCFVPQKFVQLL